MIYDELYNTGDCQTSLYLGCKHCKKCVVDEYNKEVEKELKRKEEEEQEMLKKLYGAEDKSHIYKNDDKCVNNKDSTAYKNVLKQDAEFQDYEYYPGIEDLMTNYCYNCNRCGIWGK